jgi:nucleoside phosphorylase
MRLLLVASHRREFDGMVAHAEETRPASYPVEWSRSGWLSGNEVVMASNGVGAKRAGAAVDAIAAKFRPEAVISTGFCGALDLAFNVGDVVVGTSVAGAEMEYPAWPVTGAAPFHTGVIRSVDHVVQTAEEKTRLSLKGACAVDMEAAGVAARANALDLSFCCVKTVTDLADETLANDFNRALRPDGHFDTIVILRGTLRRPTARLPELIRLRKRCALAARTLGDFFADCRF